MRKNGTPVLVQRLPERVKAEQVRALKRDLEPFMNADRPRIVFDLSEVLEMDSAGIDMLLDCMTRVARHDGDLKLAVPSPRVLVILELTQLDRLFEIFETSEEAAASFGGVLVSPGSTDLLYRPSLDRGTSQSEGAARRPEGS